MKHVISLFKLVNLLFIIETCLILVGLKFHKVSYGIEVQAAMKELFVVVCLIISIPTFFMLKNSNTTIKNALVCMVGLIMIILGAYFVLNKNFRLDFN